MLGKKDYLVFAAGYGTVASDLLDSARRLNGDVEGIMDELGEYVSSEDIKIEGEKESQFAKKSIIPGHNPWLYRRIKIEKTEESPQGRINPSKLDKIIKHDIRVTEKRMKRLAP